ncbi:haloalkane dehalogenase [Sandaracinobacteroides saxicola]|uniref:Haloalkane dehalogenase n=1 Tax=Sandaracinobacteroides saxicola TaxID=2759707 RepID=A0A7G5IL06_9SPHN|nr:haloalkane dehalogenase [Sandaracinobacteroides saxicola]QMW24048.1 haloalkane dehalogenase [Sandaracinobacteroides saxicola]
MTVLRTADAAFEALEAWPYTPHYTMIDGGALGPLRLAHHADGPAGGQPILCLHGEPSWSYLYRKMLPRFAAAGHFALAPDLIGFGRSDKPADQAAYSYNGHVGWMLDWLDRQQLSNITLFCQDWGGLIGLRLVAARPHLFARVAVSNSFLPTGEGKPSEAFLAWQAYSQRVEDFDCGWILNGGTARGISDGAKAAYRAPFPTDAHKAGARRFPLLVPTAPDTPGAAENREAWKTLETFDKPFLTLFGDSDPVTAGADRVLQSRIPGAKGQPHRTIARAGHFSQEDAGEELADAVIAWIAV